MTENGEPTGDGNTTPPEGNQAGQQQGQQQGQKQQAGFDYESAYKALQGKYQTLKESSDTTIATLTSDLADLKTKLSAADQGKAADAKTAQDLATKIDNLQKQLDEKAQELSKADVRSKRAQIVMKDYPDLAPLEAIGGLPVPEGDFNEDGFKAVLDQYQAALGGIIDRQMNSRLSGETPPNAGSGQKQKSKQPTAESLMDEMIVMAKEGKGGTAEYRQLQDAYDELTMNK